MQEEWITVIGVLGGAAMAIAGQVINNLIMFRKEDRVKKMETEKQNFERRLKQEADKFKVYNRVLNEDGRHQYVRELAENEPHLNFSYHEYKNVMRPILLENIDIFSIEVFDLVRKLDTFNYDDMDYIEPQEWENDMAIIYRNIIKAIEREYKMERL